MPLNMLMAALTFTVGAVTFTWLAAVICTLPVGALMVMPLESISHRGLRTMSVISMELLWSLSVAVSPPGVESVMVAPLAGCSTMAMRVPALPVRVQRSTLSPAPPSVSGAVSCPFQRLPMTIAPRGSPPRKATTTSSPMSGMKNAPRMGRQSRHGDASPDGAVLIGDAIGVVEPHLHAVAILRILHADHRWPRKSAGASSSSRGVVQQQTHAGTPAPRYAHSAVNSVAWPCSGIEAVERPRSRRYVFEKRGPKPLSVQIRTNAAASVAAGDAPRATAKKPGANAARIPASTSAYLHVRLVDAVEYCASCSERDDRAPARGNQSLPVWPAPGPEDRGLPLVTEMVWPCLKSQPVAVTFVTWCARSA